MNSSGDIAVDQTESVVAIDGVRLIRETEPVQRAVEPVSRSIAGKDSSRTVAAMRRRRESHNQKTGIRGTEARNRSAPVFLVAKAPHFYARDLFSVRG